jgi:hypothetical protein
VSDLRTYRLIWPRETTGAVVATAIRALATTAGTPVTLDALGRNGRVEHRLHLVDGRSGAVLSQLRAAITGVALEHIQPDALPDFGLALDLRLTTCRRALHTDNSDAISRSVLTALANVGRDEAVLLRWHLTDRLHPAPVASAGHPLPPESLTHAILSAPFGAPPRSDADTRGALRQKQGEAGWRLVGQLAVAAASAPRRQQLANAVLGALRTAEAPGVRIGARPTSGRALHRPRRHGRIRLNVSELSAVAGWPIGITTELPVLQLGSRRLPASQPIPGVGRVIGGSTWPGPARKLALSPDDSRMHLHLLGPSGVGKSTLLVNLALQDIRAGRGLVAIDVKGDLVSDILARIPADRAGDVVVIDPARRDAPVGLNPLAVTGSAELAADQLLSVFHALYAANWGPRTQDILGVALMTLAKVGGHSLVSVPLLLTHEGFRRRVVGKVGDPVGVGAFWAQYEAWSEPERTLAIAPVLNKLRPFVMREGLRRIVGQAQPKFRFDDVFTHQRIVLIDLAKGRIGLEAAQLLGAFALMLLWQAILNRSHVPAEKREPVNVLLDEFQDYLALPLSLEDALAQARGLGVGFTLAHQHLKQLTPSVKAAVLANARSRVCFQLAAEDAREVARNQTRLAAEDFMSLDAYHFYAQLVAGNKVQPWCSGRTFEAGRQHGRALRIRERSAERYGTPAAEVDEQIERLIAPRTATAASGRDARSAADEADDLTPRRRSGGRS